MRFSIITPSYNQARFLPAALQSVLSQQGRFEIEHIIVDGGSNDGSRAVLESIADERVKWTSGPDEGQSDALNRGLARASGDVVGWLNSDDTFEPGAFASVAAAFDASPNGQWLVGRNRIIDERGREIRKAITRYKNFGLGRYSYRRLLRENFISQMAVFWRRSFGQTVGAVDKSLRFAMDYDLWLRMGARSDPILVDRVLANFRIHGDSKSTLGTREQFLEQYQVATRYFEGDLLSQVVHRLNIEKILLSYRVIRLLRQ